eukprot:m.136479 g.136479  ORF g.136479 m.136479 type:complete len:691 (+) comp29855_c0_seq1:387-2459(+)
MSKFRARALDAHKHLPIYRSSDHPDILNDASTSRGVVALPTGMEKDEEEETHILQIIQQTEANPLQITVVIPIPEVTASKNKNADRSKFSLPKQYIRTHGFGLQEEQPNYDMDSEDEKWLDDLNTTTTTKANKVKKNPLSKTDFERIAEHLESLSVQGLHLQNLKSKDLVQVHNYDQAVVKQVIEYLGGRLKREERDSVTPRLQYEKFDSTTPDAYVAFRRRTERMQTRKNQRNVEANYMNMLKLHRDLIRCREMLALIKRREKEKYDLLKVNNEILEKRFLCKDWNEVWERRVAPQPALKLNLLMRPQTTLPEKPKSGHMDPHAMDEMDRSQVKRKKPKRKRLEEAAALGLPHIRPIKARKKTMALAVTPHTPPTISSEESSDGDAGDSSDVSSAVTEDEYDHHEPFRLRRRFNMFYHAPLSLAPDRLVPDGQFIMAHRPPKYEKDRGDHEHERDHDRDSPTIVERFPVRGPSLRGLCRRRIGRGGRVFIDRGRVERDSMRHLTMLTKEQVDDMNQQAARLKDIRERYAAKQDEDAAKAKEKASTESSTTPSGHSYHSHPHMHGHQHQHHQHHQHHHHQHHHEHSSNKANPNSGSRRPSRARGAVNDNPYAKSYTNMSGNSSSRAGNRVGSTPTQASSPTPTTPTTPTSKSRLPPAGSDFGSGGENVQLGPKIRLSDSSQWIPATSLKK